MRERERKREKEQELNGDAISRRLASLTYPNTHTVVRAAAAAAASAPIGTY